MLGGPLLQSLYEGFFFLGSISGAPDLLKLPYTNPYCSQFPNDWADTTEGSVIYTIGVVESRIG